MEKQEFNLSEKAQRFHLDYDFYCETDIKEFIRLLKEELIKNNKNDGRPKMATFDIIDKLAGPKLK